MEGELSFEVHTIDTGKDPLLEITRQQTGEGCFAFLLMRSLKHPELEEKLFINAMKLTNSFKRQRFDWVMSHLLALSELAKSNVVNFDIDRVQITITSSSFASRRWKDLIRLYSQQGYETKYLQSESVPDGDTYTGYIRQKMDELTNTKIIVRVTVGDLYPFAHLPYLPHFIEVVGYRNNYFKIHDPWNGEFLFVSSSVLEIAILGPVTRLNLEPLIIMVESL